MATYGIDLGTTYSCIAKLDQNGNPEVIQNFENNSYTVASAVFFEENSEKNNIIVGEYAKSYRDTSPERLVEFAKREIGRREPGEPKGREYKIDDQTYTPIEISAMILKKLKEMAEDQGEAVSDVIITCPAYFGLEERAATKKAGEIAGMNVLNLINEPTAAAINYCYREFQDNQVVLVYDLGGGTFDVTVLRMSMTKEENGNDKQHLKILSSTGNDMLGGKDWDDRLYNILLDKFCQEAGTSEDDLEADTRQSIRSMVEEIKIKLSQRESAKGKIRADTGELLDIVVARAEFEEATRNLVAQTMDLLNKALEEAGLGEKDIDKVLLVGGSTWMPMIRTAVKEKFPGIVQIEDPDRAVAKGAAIYASILVEEEEPISDNEKEEGKEETVQGQDSQPVYLGGEKPGVEIEDQTPRSFGLGVLIGEGNDAIYTVDNLIMKGTVMPTTATGEYATMYDNQPSVLIRVFESMALEKRVRPCIDADGNPQDTNPEYLMKVLGELVLKMPPNTPAGNPIEVTFMIDASGVHVTAKNLVTGESNEADIKYATSMTKEETEESKIKLNMLTISD